MSSRGDDGLPFIAVPPPRPVPEELRGRVCATCSPMHLDGEPMDLGLQLLSEVCVTCGTRLST